MHTKPRKYGIVTQIWLARLSGWILTTRHSLNFVIFVMLQICINNYAYFSLNKPNGNIW